MAKVLGGQLITLKLHLFVGLAHQAREDTGLILLTLDLLCSSNSEKTENLPPLRLLILSESVTQVPCL